MHHLNRSVVPAPTCLSLLHHGTSRWDQVTSAQKLEIWLSLNQFQGRLCAYCEGSLDALGQHIEHFRRRHTHPELIFAWSNLLGSCDHHQSCGRYKDNGAGAYNGGQLIDPSGDEPDLFFHFNLDGTISIRPGLSPADRNRAEETTRVLGLNPDAGRLRNMRRNATAGYDAILADLQSMIEQGMPLVDVLPFIQDELTATADQPFGTAIRHAFQDLLALSE